MDAVGELVREAPRRCRVSVAVSSSVCVRVIVDVGTEESVVDNETVLVIVKVKLDSVNCTVLVGCIERLEVLVIAIEAVSEPVAVLLRETLRDAVSDRACVTDQEYEVDGAAVCVSDWLLVRETETVGLGDAERTYVDDDESESEPERDLSLDSDIDDSCVADADCVSSRLVVADWDSERSMDNVEVTVRDDVLDTPLR